uniref:Uncharacterized protein LOC111111166 n=1 Tax=Crassostrea virginica TaxID=6565 RepID=A0A8B8BZP4_CRAVI|nr:uncharacterized protein LOC111111166 [Crassostrea virginica]XP_022308775.1 uncharacterized protein LOC111114662 [Crassostrea virginica]
MINAIFLLILFLQEGCNAAALFSANATARSGRHKRWDEEVYDDYSEGEVDYKEETEEESKIKWLMMNWEKLALKFIFIMAFILMVLSCIVNCCVKHVKALYKSCAFMCKICRASCCPCLGAEGDRYYQQAKAFAERFGFKLPPDAYKQLMESAKEGAKQAAESKARSGF